MTLPRGTRHAIIRIANPNPGGRGWWYFTGANWSVDKALARIYPTDYDAAVVVVRNGLKGATLLRA